MRKSALVPFETDARSGRLVAQRNGALKIPELHQFFEQAGGRQGGERDWIAVQSIHRIEPREEGARRQPRHAGLEGLGEDLALLESGRLQMKRAGRLRQLEDRMQPDRQRAVDARHHAKRKLHRRLARHASDAALQTLDRMT